MTGQWGQLTRDMLAHQGGDPDAIARIARRGLPMLARHMFPALSPFVDAGSELVDHFIRPELAIEPGPDGTFATPGVEPFYRWLRKLDYGVVLVIGRPRVGKTALLCRMADVWQGNARRLFMVTPRPESLAGTPLQPFPWKPKSLLSLGQGDVVLIPDAGLYLDSTDFGSDAEKLVRYLATLAGQKGIRFAIDVQYSSLLTKSAFLARSIIYKPLGDAWEVTERDVLRKMARLSERGFNELIPPTLHREYAFAYCSELGWSGFFRYDMPNWYSDAISKPNFSGAGTVLDVETGEDVSDQDDAFEDDVAELMAQDLTRIQAEAVILARERAKGKKS